MRKDSIHFHRCSLMISWNECSDASNAFKLRFDLWGRLFHRLLQRKYYITKAVLVYWTFSFARAYLSYNKHLTGKGNEKSLSVVVIIWMVCLSIKSIKLSTFRGVLFDVYMMSRAIEFQMLHFCCVHFITQPNRVFYRLLFVHLLLVHDVRLA